MLEWWYLFISAGGGAVLVSGIFTIIHIRIKHKWEKEIQEIKNQHEKNLATLKLKEKLLVQREITKRVKFQENKRTERLKMKIKYLSS